MTAIMRPETEKQKVGVLKLPNQNEWRGLLEFYSDVLREEINETEDANITNEEEAELPPFVAKRFASHVYSENDYTLDILGDLFKGKELNSYECTLRMIRDDSNNVEDIQNFKTAWERVSRYLRDYDTLLRDANALGEIHGFEVWEKPFNFTPTNLDLQPQLLPNV